MAAQIKIIVFNTGLTPLRVSLGPAATNNIAALGSNPVDTLALNNKCVTEDVPFGYNNKKVLKLYLRLSDFANLSNVQETSFQRLY